MWTELFETHAQAIRVFHHIIPQPRKEYLAPTDVDHEQWTTIDSTVLQWIYSTISFDFLATIMEKGSTTMDTRNRLTATFQDNQNSLIVAFQHDFSSICMNVFA